MFCFDFVHSFKEKLFGNSFKESSIYVIVSMHMQEETTDSKEYMTRNDKTQRKDETPNRLNDITHHKTSDL